MFRHQHGRDDCGGGVDTGLTVVKKFVERCGGQVWLHSAPGQGTRFFSPSPLTWPPHMTTHT